MTKYRGQYPNNYKGKVALQKVRLNSQGYDSMGAYWGVGQPLYYYFAEDGDEFEITRDGFFRAKDREAAKAYIRARPLMSECRFYR